MAAGALTGAMVMRVVVDREGRVRSVDHFFSDNPSLQAAAQEQLINWRFCPYLDHGDPVQVISTLTFPFTVGRAEPVANAPAAGPTGRQPRACKVRDGAWRLSWRRREALVAQSRRRPVRPLDLRSLADQLVFAILDLPHSEVEAVGICRRPPVPAAAMFARRRIVRP